VDYFHADVRQHYPRQPARIRITVGNQDDETFDRLAKFRDNHWLLRLAGHRMA
jgi:hypothetical protein